MTDTDKLKTMHKQTIELMNALFLEMADYVTVPSVKEAEALAQLFKSNAALHAIYNIACLADRPGLMDYRGQQLKNIREIIASLGADRINEAHHE